MRLPLPRAVSTNTSTTSHSNNLVQFLFGQQSAGERRGEQDLRGRMNSSRVVKAQRPKRTPLEFLSVFYFYSHSNFRDNFNSPLILFTRPDLR